MTTKIGLDLGYANITLSDSSVDVFREPSIALVYKDVRSDARRIISVGSAAITSESEDESGKEGMLVRPFKNGILFDQQLTKEIIFNAIKAINTKDKIRCVMGVPSDFLPKQEKELFEMLEEAGVEKIYTVSRPVAALIGAGYAPTMSAISVNIGALCTEVAILYKGDIIYSHREKIGGEDFDRAVKQYLLEQGDVTVSLIVARAIKEKLGAVWKGKKNDSIDIEGTLSMTGNKIKMNVTTEDIVGVFEKPLQEILNLIVNAVKQIPTESVEEIFSNGIILSGGGAELFGIDSLLAKVLGISVTKPMDAIDCVSKGLARINGFLPSVMRIKNKNITSQLAKYYETRKNKV